MKRKKNYMKEIFPNLNLNHFYGLNSIQGKKTILAFESTFMIMGHFCWQFEYKRDFSRFSGRSMGCHERNVFWQNRWKSGKTLKKICNTSIYASPLKSIRCIIHHTTYQKKNHVMHFIYSDVFAFCYMLTIEEYWIFIAQKLIFFDEFLRSFFCNTQISQFRTKPDYR